MKNRKSAKTLNLQWFFATSYKQRGKSYICLGSRCITDIRTLRVGVIIAERNWKFKSYLSKCGSSRKEFAMTAHLHKIILGLTVSLLRSQYRIFAGMWDHYGS